MTIFPATASAGGSASGARQDVDQRRDLLGASGWRFHDVGPERQREQVLAAERPERFACLRVGFDGGAEIRGNGRGGGAPDRGIGGVPATIGLGGLHLT